MAWALRITSEVLERFERTIKGGLGLTAHVCILYN